MKTLLFFLFWYGSNADLLCFNDSTCRTMKTLRCTTDSCEGWSQDTQITTIDGDEYVYCTDGVSGPTLLLNDTFFASENCEHCYNDTCDGDYQYCLERACVSSSCYCESHLGTVVKIADGDESWYRNTTLGYQRVSTARTYPPSYPFSSGASRFHSKRQATDVTISWTQPDLYIASSHWATYDIFLNKGDLSNSFNMTSMNTHVGLPDYWFLNDMPILLRIYDTSLALKVLEQSLSSEQISNCDVPWNIFSSAFRSNFSCLPPSLQAVFILFWIFVTVVFVLLCLCLYLFTTRIKVDSFNMRAEVSPEVMMLCILLCTPCVLCQAPIGSCDSYVSIVGSSNTCFNDGHGNLECLLNSVAHIPIPYPGFQACYVFLGGSNDAEFYGNFTVSVTEVWYTYPLTLEYYTSDWTPKTCANKYCPATSKCWSGDNCDLFSTWTGTQKATADNSIDGICPTLPGVTQCSTSCGCAGCGCFFCSDACTYYRWSTLPSGAPDHTYAVYSIGPQAYYYNVFWSLTTTDFGQLSGDIAVTSASTYTLTTNVTLSVEGSLGKTITPPQEHIAISIDGTKKAYVVASATGSNELLKFGDIQSSSVGNLYTPTYNSFSVNPGQASCSLTQNGATCNYALSGVTNQERYMMPIPGTYNSMYHQMEFDAELAILDPNPAPILLDLTLTNMRMVREITNVCPLIGTITQVGGSYSSDEGAWIEFMAESTCAAGHCALRTDELGITLLTPALYLTTSMTSFTVYFKTGSKTGVFSADCLTSVDTNMMTITAEFTLADPVLSIDTNNSVSSGDAGSPTGSGISTWWGDLSIGGEIGFVIGMVAATLFVIVCLYEAAKWVYGMHQSKEYMQYVRKYMPTSQSEGEALEELPNVKSTPVTMRIPGLGDY